jgi:hypothetical protein
MPSATFSFRSSLAHPAPLSLRLKSEGTPIHRLRTATLCSQSDGECGW